MKKSLIFLIFPLLLSGCVGMSSTDGDSTKKWISVVSSKADMDGDVYDVCYRLNLRFSPAEAEDRINTDAACITKCCWYSDTKTVEFRLNDTFPDDLVQYGVSKKYAPEKIKFYMNYSPFLNTIHGKAEPASAVRSDGLVKLDYTEIRNQERFLTAGHDPVKAAVFEADDDGDTNKGEYLFKKQPKQEATPAQKAAAAKAQEEAALSSMNDQDREALLQQKLSYERRQAVILVKRFYDREIDSYIMNIDKSKKRQGLVLLTNDRKWVTVKIGSPIYKVTCRVNGQLGKTQNDMKAYPIACGVYEVNLDDNTVTAKDTAARSIISGEYKN